jgi:hypothetical protein
LNWSAVGHLSQTEEEEVLESGRKLIKNFKTITFAGKTVKEVKMQSCMKSFDLLFLEICN